MDGQNDEQVQKVRNEGAILIRGFLEYLLDSLQKQDGRTLISSSMNKNKDVKMSNDDDLDELEIGIMVKDFEQYIDNLPNPLFINSVTSKQVKLD